MIEYIQSNQDVIAIKVTGKLMRDELETVADRVEAMLAANDKTHVFVEIADYSGFELAAISDYLPHALRMLGQLDRFGRVAIVSDQRWIRWAAKVESALLPGISYETFMPDQRDQALAWVEGRSESPRAPSLRIIETDRPDVLGFELNGRVTASEATAMADHINASAPADRPLRLLARVRRIDGAELGALFGHKYLETGIGMLHRVERYAVVGGPDWLCAWLATLQPLLKLELKHFSEAEEPAAWAWLNARPKLERPLAA
jgi:hypothetical protein